jgi:hypothetical protein
MRVGVKLEIAEPRESDCRSEQKSGWAWVTQ